MRISIISITQFLQFHNFDLSIYLPPPLYCCSMTVDVVNSQGPSVSENYILFYAILN